MRSEELDRALGATPQSFARRMEGTLLELKEEKEVKRVAFRTVLVVALVTALLCSTAYALVIQGLEWYYNNRFTAYQQYEPEKHQAIMNHLQTQVPQTKAEDPDISIAVTEVSWVPEEKVLVVALAAAAAEPDKAELHPMWNLDADGAYVGKDNLELYADDEEARGEHWLWTSAGFGPVVDMVAPGKQLLLLDADGIYLDGRMLIGDMSSVDAYVAEDGTVHTVFEIRLDYMEEDYISQQQALLEQYPEQTFRLDNIETARKLTALVEHAERMELTIPYTVTPYTEDDAQLYTGGREGEIAFTVELK
ncbi:MAG: hypothetical protein J6K13_07470 [Clostridia bacterium]|nr:hypothetical protein [Clostridia bacterium]